MASIGEGAADQARRAGERATRYRAQARAAEAQQRAWAAGAEGERLVGQALTPLEAEGWVLLHDVRWPGRARANLDHVAIGPGGTVVVDSKNWSGDVTVRGGVLRVGSWRKDRDLDAVASAAGAVAALLPPDRRSQVRGALCLVRQDVAAHGSASGVAIVGRGSLVETLRSLPPVLSPADVADTVARLRPHLLAPAPGAPDATARRHPAGRQQAPRRARRLLVTPAADRLVRIVIALLVVWFALTQLPSWPVR